MTSNSSSGFIGKNSQPVDDMNVTGEANVGHLRGMTNSAGTATELKIDGQVLVCDPHSAVAPPTANASSALTIDSGGGKKALALPILTAAQMTAAHALTVKPALGTLCSDETGKLFIYQSAGWVVVGSQS